MQTTPKTFAKHKALAWTVAGLLLSAASLPALMIPMSQAQTLASAEVSSRQDACQNALGSTATRYQGVLQGLTLTIPASESLSIAYTLADVQHALIQCGDYQIDQFCAGNGCSDAALTLRLRK